MSLVSPGAPTEQWEQLLQLPARFGGFLLFFTAHCPADTSCVLFLPFLFPQIKKHKARTSYGHRVAWCVPRNPELGTRAEILSWHKLGEGKGHSPAEASPIPHSLPGNQLSSPGFSSFHGFRLSEWAHASPWFSQDHGMPWVGKDLIKIIYLQSPHLAPFSLCL